jgi:hypothetical protein
MTRQILKLGLRKTCLVSQLHRLNAEDLSLTVLITKYSPAACMQILTLLEREWMEL